MTDRPEGRRALYSVPAAGAAGRGTGQDAEPAPGKEALYSAGRRIPGTLVVECSSCGACSRLDYTEFARRHVPFFVWIPGRRFSRWLRCPVCERRTWLGARWLA